MLDKLPENMTEDDIRQAEEEIRKVEQVLEQLNSAIADRLPNGECDEDEDDEDDEGQTDERQTGGGS